jgi:hypothetical protein
VLTAPRHAPLFREMLIDFTLRSGKHSGTWACTTFTPAPRSPLRGERAGWGDAGRDGRACVVGSCDTYEPGITVEAVRERGAPMPVRGGSNREAAEVVFGVSAPIREGQDDPCGENVTLRE